MHQKCTIVKYRMILVVYAYHVGLSQMLYKRVHIIGLFMATLYNCASLHFYIMHSLLMHTMLMQIVCNNCMLLGLHAFTGTFVDYYSSISCTFVPNYIGIATTFGGIFECIARVCTWGFSVYTRLTPS